MAAPTRRLQLEDAQSQASTRAQSQHMEKTETELRLEKLLFGDEPGFLDSLTTSTKENGIVVLDEREGRSRESSSDGIEGATESAFDEELFFLDTGRSDLPQTTSVEPADKNDPFDFVEEKVWCDSDDERLVVSLASDRRLRKLRDTDSDDKVSGVEYIRRLRRQYEHLHPPPEWVKYARKKRKVSRDNSEFDASSEASESDEISTSAVQPLSELLRSTEFLTRVEARAADGQLKRRLRSEVIDVQRLADVTRAGPSSIDTMQFHPHYPLILSAGPSATINLYHLSPQSHSPNPYFHTWSLATGMIQKVTRPMYGSGNREQRTTEHFAISPCGRYMGLIGHEHKAGGTVNILSTESMQWLCACRVDSRDGIADFSWWGNGNGFAAVGKNGEVSEYNIGEKRVVSRWLDEGAIGITTIALGGYITGTHLGGSRWVAIGSSSGVVNIYDRGEWSSGSDGDDAKTFRKPKPIRTLDQLTTPTSHLIFSDDGQMLVMSSRWKKDALRLIHLPSCTVYKNWPTDRTPLGRVSSVALSSDGQHLAVANEQGRIRLFQIRD